MLSSRATGWHCGGCVPVVAVAVHNVPVHSAAAGGTRHLVAATLRQGKSCIAPHCSSYLSCPPAHPSRTVTYRVTFRNATRSQRKAPAAGEEGSLWQKCRAALSQTAACTRDGLRGLLLPTGFFPPEFPPAKSSGWSVGSRCAGVGDRLPVVPSVHQSRLWRRTHLTACCDADRQPPPSS